jgi:hypothetical protein
VTSVGSSVSVAGILSGVALVLSGLFPWVRSGAGSSLRGVELAAALRSGAGRPDWAPEAALGILTVAALGLAQIGSSASVGRVAISVRLGVGVVVGVGLVVVAVAANFSANRWGLGLKLAAVGSVIALVGSMVEILLARMRVHGKVS